MNSKPDSSTSPNEKTRVGISPESRISLEQLRPFRRIPMNISVELGRGKINLRDLLGLRYHSIFTLDQSAGTKLNVYVNGVLLGRGEPVVLDDRMGIKIDEILDSQR